MLHYSEKALRQVKGAPPDRCSTHTNTTYARVPEELREHTDGFTLWCAECLKGIRRQITAYQVEADKIRREQRAVERQERRGRLERTRATADQAEANFAVAFSEVEKWRKDVENRPAVSARLQRDLRRARAQVTSRTEELQRARVVLARALQREKDAAEALEAQEAQVERAALAGPGLHILRDAKAAADAAWDYTTKSYRKANRDHALHRNAEQVIQDGCA